MPRFALAALLVAVALNGAGCGPARAADAPPPPTAPAPAPASTPAPPPAPPPAPRTKVVPLDQAMGVLGHVVDGPDGKDVGRVVDVLVDQEGAPRAAVLDVGGFLGVGNRVVSIAWDALHFAPAATDHQITTKLTPDQIRAAPEYQAAKAATVVMAPGQH